jgi:hypothetical protein
MFFHRPQLQLFVFAKALPQLTMPANLHGEIDQHEDEEIREDRGRPGD